MGMTRQRPEGKIMDSAQDRDRRMLRELWLQRRAIIQELARVKKRIHKARRKLSHLENRLTAAGFDSNAA